MRITFFRMNSHEETFGHEMTFFNKRKKDDNRKEQRDFSEFFSCFSHVCHHFLYVFNQ